MPTQLVRLATLLCCLLCGGTAARAQAINLLQNANADEGAAHWRAVGEAVTGACAGERRCFVVRNGGSFYQDVPLPDNVGGQYAALIGHGASERINADGAITDLPYLYGYMLSPLDVDDNRIYAYLQGQEMRSSARIAGDWVKLWGIFQVPKGTGRIRFFIDQALRKGIPHDGSAASFADLGLYLFATEHEARAFVQDFK